MLRGRWFRFGYACVNFGGLISARDWLADARRARAAATCAASTRTSAFEIVGRLAQRRDGRDRPPRAGAAGVADRHGAARSRGPARRARAQGAGVRPDGAFREPAAPSSTCRAATATMPSMSACACWRCATWSRRAAGLFAAAATERPAARILRQRHRPSALTMITTLWRIAYAAGTGYFTNRLSTSAAAMAFYTMFALGPIMIFSIAIAEPFVGKLMAQQAIFDALSTVVGAGAAQGHPAASPRRICSGAAASPPSSALSCCSIPARRVFVELDDGIDAIWRDRRRRSHASRAGQPAIAAAARCALMVVLGVLLIAVILAQRAALGLCRRAGGVPGPRRLDRPGDVGVACTTALLVGLLHPDLQVAADRRRAVEISP